jgi:hypothetical protein
MKEAFSNVNNFFRDIVLIVEYARCPYLNYAFTSAVENGFCEEIFSGLYVMWITMTIAVTCLLIMMVAAGLLYPHYRAKFATRIRRLCCVCILTAKGLRKLCRRRVKHSVLRRYLDEDNFDDLSSNGSSVLYDERSYTDEDSVLDDVYFSDDSSHDSDYVSDTEGAEGVDDGLGIEMAELPRSRDDALGSSDHNILHRYASAPLNDGDAADIDIDVVSDCCRMKDNPEKEGAALGGEDVKNDEYNEISQIDQY